jgi:diguanylate cyclase (GGDEF)-like protein
MTIPPGKDAGANDLAGRVALLSRMLSLPPLGQIGRHKYGPFLRGALELFDAQGVSLGFWVSPHELRRFRAQALEPGSEVHEDALDPGEREGALRSVLRHGATILLDPSERARYDPEVEGYPGHAALSCLLIGLKMRDEPPAALSLFRFQGEPFGREDEALATAYAPLFASAVDNLRRFSRAEELSITDGLTGVYNYRYMRSALDKEIARSKRFRDEFSIIMLDVDHLKEYNDVHGHLRGSEVLRCLAQVVIGELRSADILAKYGGDEFVIILPQTGRGGAKILAERIRAAVEAHEFPGEEEGMQITSSMGIATYPEDAQATRELLESADSALYEAKRQGRNRVHAVASGAGSR